MAAMGWGAEHPATPGSHGRRVSPHGGREAADATPQRMLQEWGGPQSACQPAHLLERGEVRSVSSTSPPLLRGERRLGRVAGATPCRLQPLRVAVPCPGTQTTAGRAGGPIPGNEISRRLPPSEASFRGICGHKTSSPAAATPSLGSTPTTQVEDTARHVPNGWGHQHVAGRRCGVPKALSGVLTAVEHVAADDDVHCDMRVAGTREDDVGSGPGT